MAGYSGTPLPKKLGIKPGARLLLDGAPAGFLDSTLGDLPDGATVVEDGDAVDVIVWFVTSFADLAAGFASHGDRIAKDGGLWIAWPKRASKIPTDVTEDRLRDVGLPLGLVDNKVCAIDETWSGLRFVWRKELR